MTDDELKSELIKLLDNHFGPNARDTEWLHACYLVRVKHNVDVMVGWNEPWQEQARHLLRHIAARAAVAEAKA